MEKHEFLAAIYFIEKFFNFKFPKESYGLYWLFWMGLSRKELIKGVFNFCKNNRKIERGLNVALLVREYAIHDFFEGVETSSDVQSVDEFFGYLVKFFDSFKEKSSSQEGLFDELLSQLHKK